jgi:glycosyltransferase involved in cell wall biosynthesis
MAIERRGALPFYYPRAAWTCARETRRGRYDIVLECLNKLPFFSPLYSAAPVLALCHHLFGDAAFLQVAWPIAATVWSAERLVPPLYRREHFVTISESTRDDLVRRGVAPERVEVHHPGIDRPAGPLPKIEERPPRIAFVGRLERYKNVDVLLRAVARIANRFPEAELVVIGQGGDRDRLERVAAELGVASRVRFAGFVSDAERDAVLADSRVCVCPSTKEGWGLTVVESNAFGVPNVATDAPGLRDSVRDGETGFLVPDGDVAAFADRIAVLLGDDALAGRMSAAALEWSRRFDWERATDQMAAALEAALRGR